MEHRSSYKLLINGEKVFSGTKDCTLSEMKKAIYSDPFRTFLMKECEGADYIIAGLTNPILSKLYKFILKNEDAQEVIQKVFRQIIDSKASGRNGYEYEDSYHKKEVRFTISRIIQLYNEIYGTDYDTNFTEVFSSFPNRKDEWKRDEEKIKGKTKISLSSILEYEHMMYPYIMEQVEIIIKKHGRDKCRHSQYNNFKITFPQ